ncbi:MAG: cytochrome c oxidase subunit II [Ardenticatenales bacterium]|nr:cytochrome c oxidase subunit II [Ardenticatenales bacterium]
MTFGRITIVLTVILAIFLAFIYYLPAMPWFLPTAAVDEAQGIDDLLRLMMVVGGGLYIFIQGFLLYFVWLYRRKPEDGEDAVGRALHGDNRLEIAWTVAPALFIVVLTVLSLRELDKLGLNEPREGARVIVVTGQQFAWTFAYPETGITEVNTLTLQKDVPVTFNITAVDVTHAFWIPNFRIKQDATPGFTLSVTMTPNKVGEFPFRCAEFCGAGHSSMLAKVNVLEEAEYLVWQETKLAGGGPGADANPEEIAAYGLELYTAQGCGACHALEAGGTSGAVGPTHNGLGTTAEQRVEAADYTGSATTAEEYLRESLREPGAHIVEGFPPAMPPYGEDKLPEGDLNALVQMLLQQK